MSGPRTVAWFSCGVASAVAAKIAVDEFGAVVAYCDTSASEHPDNLRFLADVSDWIGQPVLRLRSSLYVDIDDVFDKTRYMAGINGARCTVEMKKVPRFEFQRPDDIHVFGLTADEGDRIERFKENNHDLSLRWVLADAGLTKADCHRVIGNAGIALPVLYSQGFRNNNCIGCVKATSRRYWTMVRDLYPETFERRARQSRELGVRLTRVGGNRVFLDELPPGLWKRGKLENVSCGPDCTSTPAIEAAGREGE